MDRRKVLLIVAAVVAALGTLLVFIYVRGADNRAQQQYSAVQVIKAVKPISAGETVAEAQSAGKFELGSVPQADRLPDAITDLNSINGEVALTAIFPGEQIIPSKFGTTATGTTLQIPKGMLAISVNLSDTARVAGFVNPGDHVSIFMNGAATSGQPADFSRMLVPDVEVIGVGTTSTTLSTTTTDESGTTTKEQLPRTLLTLAVNQKDAEKILYAVGHGDLAFGLLGDKSAPTKDGGANDRNLFQ